MLSAVLNFLKEILLLVGAVTTKSSFPAPLSADEEKEAIFRLTQGDCDARDMLIEHNLRLVAHIAKKYAAKGRDTDDLISAGTIGLIKAVGTFNAEKGKTIAAYAARCIENEILMFIRAERKQRGEVSLSEPIGVDRDGNEITLADILSSSEALVPEQAERNIAGCAVRGAINDALTERERAVIKMRYGIPDGLILPQREVAKKLRISRSYVSRIEKRALGKLNNFLSGTE